MAWVRKGTDCMGSDANVNNAPCENMPWSFMSFIGSDHGCESSAKFSLRCRQHI